MIGYLALGLVAYLLARRSRPGDWGETLLASVFAPPLIGLLAAAAAANFVRTRLEGSLLAQSPVTGGKSTS
jgi:hypothetical protein